MSLLSAQRLLRPDGLIVDDQRFGQSSNRRLGVGGALEETREQAGPSVPVIPRCLARSPLTPTGILGSLAWSRRGGHHGDHCLPDDHCRKTANCAKLVIHVSAHCEVRLA
jgi:hypothetical protein